MPVDVSNAISITVDRTRALPLGALLAYHAAKNSRAPALTVSRQTLTYAELDARSNRRARALSDAGARKGGFVAIAIPNSVEFYETTFALWKLGAVPTVVSHKLPAPELEAIVGLLDPDLIVGADKVNMSGRRHLPSGLEPDHRYSADTLEIEVSPHWKAMTSGGSTGRPKIIVDHMPGLWDPGSTSAGQILNDRLLNPGPLYHNAPFSCMHYGLFGGGHVVDMQKFDAEHALALIETYRIGWINLVPTMMHRIMALPQDVRERYDISSLRVVFHMAAPCPVWLKQAWIDWIGPERLFELYGGTERQGATLISGSEWLKRRGSVGKVQQGARMRILRDDGSDCAPGEVGEVYFLPDAGRNATYHYIGAEAKARGEWESLGDLGFMDSEGYLFLSDRRSDLILCGGANVYPAEVEAAIESHPAVATAVVIGLDDADLGQVVHAIVECNAGANVTPIELLEHIRSQIALYKTPRSIEFVDYPLRDEAGKVRRGALRDAIQTKSKPAH